MEKICRACEIEESDELVKRMPLHTCGKDGPPDNWDALKTPMEDNGEHSLSDKERIEKMAEEFWHQLDKLANQLKQRDSEISELKEALKETVSSLDYIIKGQSESRNLSYGMVWVDKWKAIVDNARKLIE